MTEGMDKSWMRKKETAVTVSRGTKYEVDEVGPIGIILMNGGQGSAMVPNRYGQWSVWVQVPCTKNRGTDPGAWGVHEKRLPSAAKQCQQLNLSKFLKVAHTQNTGHSSVSKSTCVCTTHSIACIVCTLFNTAESDGQHFHIYTS